VADDAAPPCRIRRRESIAHAAAKTRQAPRIVAGDPNFSQRSTRSCSNAWATGKVPNSITAPVISAGATRRCTPWKMRPLSRGRLAPA
jgi:hypothetical protein